MFCDICDEFDLHETEDCPKQSSDSPVPFEQAGEKKDRKIPEPRKYCENCEGMDFDFYPGKSFKM